MPELRADTNKEQRQAKHIQIAEAIDRLSVAERRLKDLLYEINGEGDDRPDKQLKSPEVSATPTLLDVLNGAPQEIFERANNIRSLTKEIRQSIF